MLLVKTRVKNLFIKAVIDDRGRPSWKQYDNQNEKSNENIQPRIMCVRFQRIQSLQIIQRGLYHQFGRRETGLKTPLGRREKAKKGQKNLGRREKGNQFWEKGEEVCNEYYALVDVGNAM